ncbi:hypothetical protein BFAG_02732 [Bacteroides fragilis 3_1_12]|uniref:Uncharacterized protein n=1 Tax=Bacteroides fragilis 3_1_12 TaxID=457424 RepID=A0ABN0BM82_BACFG|nr:hypothetical protein BFAG_02732 [Bacteroides fragilis 3_1_12]
MEQPYFWNDREIIKATFRNADVPNFQNICIDYVFYLLLTTLTNFHFINIGCPSVRVI